MENTGALAILILAVVAAGLLWAINRAGTRAGLSKDVRTVPRRVEGRPVNPERPGLGGDTFTAADDVLEGAGGRRAEDAARPDDGGSGAPSGRGRRDDGDA